MRDEKDRTRLMVKVLVAIVVLLIIIVAYLTVISSAINNFAAQKQVEGANLFISQILIPELQTQGYVALPLGNNQTLYLVPYNPNQNRTVGNTSTNSTK